MKKETAQNASLDRHPWIFCQSRKMIVFQLKINNQ